MADLIVGGIILVIVGLAARYVYKSRKRGMRCIGCPAGCCCASSKDNKNTSCSCCSGK